MQASAKITSLFYELQIVRRRKIMPGAVASAATVERASSTLKTYSASELSKRDLLALTARPRIDFGSILDTVGLLSQFYMQHSRHTSGQELPSLQASHI